MADTLMLNARKNSKKGFTLMEMLIVVAIIAILVAIAIPVFTTQLDNAKRATDDANIRTAYSELQVYNLNQELSSQQQAVTTGSTVPSVSGKIITFSDGSTYTLQHYSGVDTSSTPWKGQ